MNSSQGIIDRILSDSNAIANDSIAQAELKAQSVIDNAEKGSSVKIIDFKNTLENTFNEIVNRKITVAKLDSKKIIMDAKKEAVDKVFKEALSRLNTLPKAEYLELIADMIKANAVDGDKIMPCYADKSKITGSFINKIAKETNLKLSLDTTYPDYQGGIILSGDNYDKNLSFEVELASMREEIETLIADILFKE